MKFIKQKNGVRVWYNEEKGVYTVKGYSTTDKEEALKHLELVASGDIAEAASRERKDEIISDIKKRDHKYTTLEEVMADPEGAELVRKIEDYRNAREGFFKAQREFAIQELADKFGFEYGR